MKKLQIFYNYYNQYITISTERIFALIVIF